MFNIFDFIAQSFNPIEQFILVFLILFLIDRFLLFLFGTKWRMPSKYEKEKEERQFPTFGS